MTQSALLRPRDLRRAVPAVLAVLLVVMCAACAGSFEFNLRSDHPAEVDSVFVIFGPESDYAGKVSTADVAPLVQPAKLAQAFGYAEYGVTVSAGSATWQPRSARLETMGIEEPKVVQGRLVFKMPNGNLSSHPDLSLAVVVRTAGRQYRIKSWKHATIENAPAKLEIDVASGEVTANF
ncbi:MAG: hypothetical protein U1F36_10670 [Planctomycetota bacterium]